MTEYVFPPAPQPSVAVVNSDARIPVRRIFCVGRNYAAHVREMGGDPDRENPFFFTKPADAVVESGQSVPYPTLTHNFHFEAELVVVIGKTGRSILEKDSLDYVWGYAVGNDLTRRDLQGEAKGKGRPWDWGKAFDNSAPCGPIHPVSQIGHLSGGNISLRVNGEIKQDSTLDKMIWSVPEIISILSHAMEIQPGDLIYTGTPEGVGALVPGDICVVSIDGLGDLTTSIVDPV